MRFVPILAALTALLALAGCLGVDDETGTTGSGPVLSQPALAQGAAQGPAPLAATAPVGLWRGGLTMLVMTTRDAASPLAAPWFGSSRASEPTAARAILYPPARTMLASVNPIASTDWSVAGMTMLPGSTPAQSVAQAAEGKDVLVYIHGFNETFDSAADELCQADLGHRLHRCADPLHLAIARRAARLWCRPRERHVVARCPRGHAHGPRHRSPCRTDQHSRAFDGRPRHAGGAALHRGSLRRPPGDALRRHRAGQSRMSTSTSSSVRRSGSRRWCRR